MTLPDHPQQPLQRQPPPSSTPSLPSTSSRDDNDDVRRLFLHELLNWSVLDQDGMYYTFFILFIYVLWSISVMSLKSDYKHMEFASSILHVIGGLPTASDDRAALLALVITVVAAPFDLLVSLTMVMYASINASLDLHM
uniref:Uncharacterized protein n=1 Tax=Oryza meridionalis TaxID=40149 RepID=A0A0E0FAW7_9ORYZ